MKFNWKTPVSSKRLAGKGNQVPFQYLNVNYTDPEYHKAKFPIVKTTIRSVVCAYLGIDFTKEQEVAFSLQDGYIAMVINPKATDIPTYTLYTNKSGGTQSKMIYNKDLVLSIYKHFDIYHKDHKSIILRLHHIGVQDEMTIWGLTPYDPKTLQPLLKIELEGKLPWE